MSIYVGRGLEFFPRAFLPGKTFLRGPRLLSEDSKAYATQIGWFNYSTSYACWD